MTASPTKITVLDHGFVELVDKMGNDLTVANAARVSMGKGSAMIWTCPKCGKAEECVGDPERYAAGAVLPFCCGELQHVTATLAEKDRKLIKYLLAHNHTSPMRHAMLTFRCKAPIFVFRQWMKHRIASEFNEVSSRYTELGEAQFYTPSTFRTQSKDNKQGSGANLDTHASMNASAAVQDCHMFSKDGYAELRELGVAKEMARIVMPVSQYSEVIWTVSLHAVLHFLSLRLDSHAQWEIQQFAKAVRTLVYENFPVVVSEYEAIAERQKADAALSVIALRLALADIAFEQSPENPAIHENLMVMRQDLRDAVNANIHCYADEMEG